MSITKTGAVLLALSAGALLIRADWPSFGGGPRRDGWNRAEDTFNTTNVKNMALEWKLKVDNTSLELNALTAPVVMEGVLTPHGFKEYVIVAGCFRHALRHRRGYRQAGLEEGTSKRTRRKMPKNPFWLCPNAQNATPAVNHWEDKHLPNNTVFALASDGKLHSFERQRWRRQVPADSVHPALRQAVELERP